MLFLDAITRYTADYRARRRRMRTYLAISSLPLEIQKDIGWSDDFDANELPVRRRRQ